MIDYYFDGGTRLNSVCVWDDKSKLYKVSKLSRKRTNNELEYLALATALEEAILSGDSVQPAPVRFVGDSQLIINQIDGLWKVKNERLQLCKNYLDEQVKQSFAIKPLYLWVPRHMNFAGVHLDKIGRGGIQGLKDIVNLHKGRKYNIAERIANRLDKEE